MSLRTVEISVPQDVPSVVSIDGGIGPKVVEINQGPAGPNSVTSATISDGTADLEVASLTASSSIICTGLEASIEVIGVDAILGVGGTGSGITANGIDSYIETSGEYRLIKNGFTATISGTLTANRAINLPDGDGTLALTSDITNAVTSATTSDGTCNLLLNSLTVGTTGDPTVIEPDAVYSQKLGGKNFGTRAINADSQTCFTWGADQFGENAQFVTISSATTLYFNNGAFLYGDGVASAHRTALELGDLATANAASTNVATATSLQTARNINGVSFNGTADITVTSAAGTLTGTTLASNVVTSSLTSVGTLTSLTVTNNIQSNAGNVSAAAAGAIGLLGRSRIYSSSDGTFQFRNNANTADATISSGSITAPSITGGTAANDDLTLQGTSNATRTTSYVLIQPNGGLTQVGAGTPVTDTALPLQLSTGASGTETNIGINKNGAYGFLLGFKNGTGTSFANYLGGYMRNVTTDPFSIIVNNVNISTTWTSDGSVGLGGSITNTTTLAGAHLIINGTTGNISIGKTITAGGTTGAQTINKTSGSVNFAAGATSLVVTNSLVSTSSVILVTMASNDATAAGLRVVAGAGSFTIRLMTAPTAEMRVNFLVTN